MGIKRLSNINFAVDSINKIWSKIRPIKRIKILEKYTGNLKHIFKSPQFVSNKAVA